METVCPVCNKELIRVNDEGISFQNCDHRIWWTNLGSIANDSLILQGGARLKLLKR